MKPCKHPDIEPGKPYGEGECRVCWLFANNADYRELWGGGQVTATGPEPFQEPPHQPAPRRPVQPRKGCRCGR